MPGRSILRISAATAVLAASMMSMQAMAADRPQKASDKQQAGAEDPDQTIVVTASGGEPLNDYPLRLPAF